MTSYRSILDQNYTYNNGKTKITKSRNTFYPKTTITLYYIKKLILYLWDTNNWALELNLTIKDMYVEPI